MLRGSIGEHVLRAVEQARVIVILPSLILNCLKRVASAERIISTPVSSLLYLFVEII